MKVTVRKGRTVQRAVIGKDQRRRVTRYGQGTDLDVTEAEAKRLIRLGAVVVAGSEDAEVAKEAKDALPADFPGREALAKAGIESFPALATVEDLTAIKGVGEATTEKIGEALAAWKAAAK